MDEPLAEEVLRRYCLQREREVDAWLKSNRRTAGASALSEELHAEQWLQRFAAEAEAKVDGALPHLRAQEDRLLEKLAPGSALKLSAWAWLKRLLPDVPPVPRLVGGLAFAASILGLLAIWWLGLPLPHRVTFAVASFERSRGPAQFADLVNVELDLKSGKVQLQGADGKKLTGTFLRGQANPGRLELTIEAHGTNAVDALTFRGAMRLSLKEAGAKLSQENIASVELKGALTTQGVTTVIDGQLVQQPR